MGVFSYGVFALVITLMNQIAGCCGKNSIDVEPIAEQPPRTAQIVILYADDKLAHAALRKKHLEPTMPYPTVCANGMLFVQSVEDSECTITAYNYSSLEKAMEYRDKFHFFGHNNWLYAEDIFCSPNGRLLFQNCCHMEKSTPFKSLRRFDITNLRAPTTEFEYDASELLLASKCGRYVLMTDTIFDRARTSPIFTGSAITIETVPETVRSLFPLADATADVPTNVNDAYTMIHSIGNIIIIDSIRDQIIRLHSRGAEYLKPHGKPSDIAFNHDRSRFFVSYFDQPRIDMFNALSIHEAPVSIPTRSHVVKLTSSHTYLAAALTNSISIFDTRNIGEMPISVPTKYAPYQLTFSTGRTKLFASFPFEHKVGVIDLIYGTAAP